MKKYRSLGAFAICALVLAAPAVQSGPVQQPVSEAKKDLLAREALSQAIAPVKSKEDLERYLKIIPPKSNVLYLLSPAARERFIATLTFNEKGLTGFGFQDLQRELSQDQIAKVLALFGSESSAVHIKPNVESRKAPSRDKNGCIDRNDLLQPIFCEDPYDGGIGDGGGGFGGGHGGDGSGRQKIPIPFPPGEEIPGQMKPVRMENGDIYHMVCAARATCWPDNNKVCKASC